MSVYPCSFIDLCIKNFLYKLYKPKSTCITTPEKVIIIVLPFLGSLSLQIRTRLRRSIKNNLPRCNLKTIFLSNYRLQSLFQFKDRMPKYLHSGPVYITARLYAILKFECQNIWEYQPELKNALKFSILQQSVITSSFVRKLVVITLKFYVMNLTSLNHCLKKSLFIHKDDPALNKTIKSTPLELFNDT